MWKAIGQKPDINFGIRQACYEIRVEIPKDGSARDLLIIRNFDRFLMATQERRAAWFSTQSLTGHLIRILKLPYQKKKLTFSNEKIYS